jgi:hypothetical protein
MEEKEVMSSPLSEHHLLFGKHAREQAYGKEEKNVFRRKSGNDDTAPKMLHWARCFPLLGGNKRMIFYFLLVFMYNT